MNKYPRTFHFQFSPEVHDDDKVISMRYLGNFLQDEIVILEKLDGANSCLKGHQGVFGRSHALPTKEPWYDHLKGLYYSKLDKLNSDYWYFGENTYAIHSIEYSNMDSYFYLFAIYDTVNEIWLSWDDLIEEAKRIDIPTVPILFRGTVISMAEVNKWMDKHITDESQLGGELEGFVMRVTKAILGDKFNEFVAKYVRKGHVQTDDHWTKNWKPQTLKVST